MGDLLSTLAGGLFSVLGNQGANAAAAESEQIMKEQADEQKKIQDYLLGKAQNVFDPILEHDVLPALLSRVQKGPFYAPDAMKQAKGLERDWTLSA